jgi:hypothetical protein
MADNSLREALVGPKSAIMEYLVSKDVDEAVRARINLWDDGVDRRATALIYYKRLREMGVGTDEAKAKVAALFKFDLRYVESLVGGSGHESARQEVKRRLKAQHDAPFAGGIHPATKVK